MRLGIVLQSPNAPLLQLRGNSRDAAVCHQPAGRDSGEPRCWMGECSCQPSVSDCVLVASTAWRISWVAASGCETKET